MTKIRKSRYPETIYLISTPDWDDEICWVDERQNNEDVKYVKVDKLTKTIKSMFKDSTSGEYEYQKAINYNQALQDIINQLESKDA